MRLQRWHHWRCGFLPDWGRRLSAVGLVGLLLWISAGSASSAASTGKTLVVGSEQDFPPFALGQTDATAGGFTVELWRAIARDQGLNYTIRVRSFSETLEEFKAGRVDVMINLAQSEARREFADFTVPHVVMHGAVFVRQGESRIRSEADLADKSIIVINADLAHDYAISRGWQRQLVPVTTAADGFKLLADGRHDAMLISQLAGMQTLRKLGIGNVVPLPAKAGFSQKFSFAVRKGDADLLARLNEGLALTKSSRVYDELYERWFGVYEVRPVTLWDLGKYLWPLALLLLGGGAWLICRQRLERPRVEAVMRESDERLRQLAETQAILDALPAKIVLISPTGVIVAVNMAWARAAQAHGHLGPRHGVGQSYLEVCECAHGDPVVALREAAGDIQRVLRGEATGFFLEYQCHSQGASRWFQLMVVPLHASHLAGAVAMHVNMTALKQAEAVRDESQRLLDKALEVGHIGSWAYEIPAPGDAQGKVIWSAETCRIFGLAPGEFDGRLDTFFDLVHPEDRERVMGATRITLANGRRFDFEYRIRHRNGQERWVRGVADVERDADQQPLRMVGVVQDITDRRQLEEQLRHSQKMEALGQLAGGIAHDFNNILGAVLGNAELAKLQPPGSPVIGDYLDSILNASRRARDLVRQILAFSGRQEQKREPMQLHTVVREALGLMRASVPAAVEFRSNIAVVPSVLANASEIHQVMMNLCTNAWHALQGRPGTITVELAETEVDEALARQHPGLRPGRYVRLIVADNGCGMGSATLARIFEPFFTTKPLGEGSGLGLAVVHGIVRNHDGVIVVSSQPGQGTSFTLHFPVFVAEVVELPAQPPPTPRGRGERILFVDDEEPLVIMGKGALERLGYRTTALASPIEALAVFRSRPMEFDLVITDLNMPGLSGTELARQLRAVRPDIQLVLTTGYSSGITEEVITELGFCELLPKPYDLRTLGETTHRALNETTLTRRS